MADKGADLALLLGGPEMESLDEGGDDYDAAFADAADAAFSALKSGDKEAFSEHLKDAIHICLEHNPGPAEEEEY
jgi:hypothetical protein|tara:strand:+ start:3122 stop:3346 length:225 start_codon:yes stop_codon:yes gene_type:complete